METFLSPLVHAEVVTKALPVILMEARKGHDELIPLQASRMSAVTPSDLSAATKRSPKHWQGPSPHLEVVLANQAWYWVLPRFDLRRNE